MNAQQPTTNNQQQAIINKQPFPGIFAGKKVWLSGVSGFKGSWLAEWLLLLGAEVRGFSLPPPTSPSLFEQLGLASRIRWDCEDIRDPAAVRESLLSADPDFVFHLAAQPLVRLSYREPVETWETNVTGTIHVLEALRLLRRGDAEALSAKTLPLSDPASQPLNPTASQPPLVAVMITSDKCYENREQGHAYGEGDPLGGYDPYSSSKAAAELAIASWRRSFFSSSSSDLPSASSRSPATRHSLPDSPSPAFSSPKRTVLIASARAGNVIGGGDWALDRIVPDAIRALSADQSIPVRNRLSTRPWQHVLEPLCGYLLLAARMKVSCQFGVDSCAQPTNQQPTTSNQEPADLCSAFNFGPALDSNRTVEALVQEVVRHWPGRWEDKSDPNAPHEAGKLNLATDKAFHLLGWQPRWNFETTISKTVGWYRAAHEGADPGELTRQQIREYTQSSAKCSEG